MCLYDITVSKLDQKKQFGPNWNGWNVKISCKVHEDTFTDINVSTQYAIEVSAAIGNLPYIDKLIVNTIDISQNSVYARFKRQLSPEQFRQDLLQYSELTEDQIPEGSVQAETETIKVSDTAEPEIFVFQAVDPADPVLDKDMFSNVATLYDMETIPAGEPVQLSDQPAGYENIPYYRMDSVEMNFLTANDAARFIRTVMHCVRGLALEYRNYDIYSEEHTVEI